MKGKLLQDFEDISLSTTTLCCWHHFHGDTLSVGESPRASKRWHWIQRLTLDGRWRGMAMSTLVQMQRVRARRIIGELLEKLSPHVPTFHPGDVKSLSGKPHMDMGMKLQPRDTAPHASRQD
ncbi:hypothetical protein JOQ06_003583 [Pogonophryne albipinna]|uniref:Uncharacterized protein n=1 Tax=Pogonophryne albipinna TaxID=1090488 RepID=A0AAD6AH62_9TELE|nr:hypothetical protein JOQ06_003583 [Pogonophryne albipinna]